MASATSASSHSNFTACIIQDSHFSDEPDKAYHWSRPHWYRARAANRRARDLRQLFGAVPRCHTSKPAKT
jgi:hypothetical protein